MQFFSDEPMQAEMMRGGGDVLRITLTKVDDKFNVSYFESLEFDQSLVNCGDFESKQKAYEIYTRQIGMAWLDGYR